MLKKHSWRSKLGIFILALGLILIVTYFAILPYFAHQLDAKMNFATKQGPYVLSDKAKTLHEDLLVADLHGDFLLWNRDFLERADRGMIDLPRLQEGNLSLQAFTIVSKVPRGLNIKKNDDSSDQVTLLAIGQHWPFKTAFSLKERALYQAEKLHEYAARSQGQFIIVKNKKDLENFLARRKAGEKITAGFLGIEGGQVLEKDFANLQIMYDTGFRMMSLTHFFDNALGDSAHGIRQGGMSELGKKVILEMERLGMVIDLAHATPALMDEIIALTNTPLLSSHTGVKGTCDNQRNLQDKHIRAIAESGGVVAIGFWETASCGKDAAAIVRAIKYVTDLVGVDHVALGSDFDGAITAPFDSSGMGLITQGLLDAGFSESDIRKIMGENTVRVLRARFPD